MMHLQLVKISSETEDDDDDDDAVGEDGLPHGTSVNKGLVRPWAYSDRIICDDSYFASVTTATERKRIMLKFVGVKTVTR
jgi:hypothetical protein